MVEAREFSAARLVWEDDGSLPSNPEHVLPPFQDLVESPIHGERSLNGHYLLAVKSIGLSRQGGRKPSTLAGAARHNLREIQAELGAHSHIDSSRTHLNEVLAGPNDAASVVQLANALIVGAGLQTSRLRKDFCQAVEIVFSLPPNTGVDTRAFFQRCVEWAAGRFGAEAVLSAVAHYDEGAPHAHVLISPLVDGKLRGSGLITRKPLSALRKSFEVLVARPFKLTMPPTRLSGEERRLAVAAVLTLLQTGCDSILQSALWETVKMLIEADPRPFVAALGVPLASAPARRKKTFCQIMTSRGRGAKVERAVHGIARSGSEYLYDPNRGALQAKPILCRLSAQQASTVQAGSAQQ